MKEWIYGRNSVYESLAANRRHFFRLRLAKGVEPDQRLSEIMRLAQAKKLPVEHVNRQQLESLGDSPQGIALEVSAYPHVTIDDILEAARAKQEAPFILILDVLQNPQNLGTLIRTAEAVGVHGIIMPERRAAGVTPAVVNSSSGASEHMLISLNNLAQAIDILKENDVWIAGLEGGEEAQPIEQIRLDGSLALVVGSEGDGLRRLTKDSCDYLVKLPMRGKVESLNAAVAGSVALYLTYMQRRKK